MFECFCISFDLFLKLYQNAEMRLTLAENSN